MNEIKTTALDRREFLRGAALLTASVALGVGAQSKSAAASEAENHAAPGNAAHTSLALWSRAGLINPAILAAGNPDLAHADVKVVIHGHFVPAGAAPVLHVLKTHYAVTVNGQVRDTPVYAWVAAPGAKDAVVRIPVAPGAGVLFSVELSAPQGSEDFYFLAAGSAPGRPKLTVGTYVLVAGTPALAGVRLISHGHAAALTHSTSAGDSPVYFEYLLITISAA